MSLKNLATLIDEFLGTVRVNATGQ